LLLLPLLGGGVGLRIGGSVCRTGGGLFLELPVEFGFLLLRLIAPAFPETNNGQIGLFLRKAVCFGKTRIFREVLGDDTPLVVLSGLF
jgi:hypothetical protein